MIKDELQEKAIALSCGKDRLVAVTGQAGTGKTTIMKQVYDRFTEAGHFVALAAPTGKAAKRISEATGIDATTIHRLLEFTHPGDPDPKTGKPVRESRPRRDDLNRLEQSVVLVDEYSMVNHRLNRQLMDAMPPGSVLRSFGDLNQLPPIEELSVSTGPPPEFSPFTEHVRRFPSVTLKNIYRQGEGSDIIVNAHRILNRMCPKSGGDFTVVLTPKQQSRVLNIAELHVKDFRSLDHQIITPTHRGWIGTRKLNELIQEIVHGIAGVARGYVMPRAKWDKYELTVCVGDKVIWTKNDYNVGIFNGETGIIEVIEDGHVTINFGDRTISVPPNIEYERGDGIHIHYDPRMQLKLAYAVTTHAAQGSEYDSIIYVMDRSAYILQDCANFYTGVTRAKKRATVVSDQHSFQRAVVTKPSKF
jgi:exodeoxyribonuclease V alpha subunit